MRKEFNCIYRKVSNIRRTKSQNINDSRLVLQLSLPNPLKLGVKSIIRLWRCGWSSADWWCSNYIWVIMNLLAYKVRLILEVWRYHLCWWIGDYRYIYTIPQMYSAPWLMNILHANCVCSRHSESRFRANVNSNEKQFACCLLNTD